MPRFLSVNLLVFLFLTMLLAGNGYIWLVNHNVSPDERVYLLLARGEFGQLTSFQRYRVLVPLLAGALTYLLPGQPGPGFAFYVINTLLLGLGGTLVYGTARAAGAGFWPALGGAVVVLSSGVATYLAGSALVDSLAWLAVAAFYYALARRHGRLLWWTMLLAPLAKEQLLLLLPVGLYYGCFLPWPPRLAAAALAGGLLVLLYALLNAWHPALAAHHPIDMGKVTADHVRNAGDLAAQLLTGYGIRAVLAVFGGFVLVLGAGLSGGAAGRRSWLRRLPPATGALAGCAFVFMVLSGEFSRMLFFAGPCFGVAVALILQYHPVVGAWQRRLAAASR